MSPRVVTPVCNPLVLAHPDQPVGTVVQLRLSELTLPVAVAVLHVPHHLGFGQAGVVLEHLIVLSRGWEAALLVWTQFLGSGPRGQSESTCQESTTRSGLHAIKKKKGILTHFWPPLAVDIVRVVALANEAKPSIPSVYKTVGTALKEALALVAVVVEVTSRLVPN